MKIGIYTDVHCCYTSSILPIHCESSQYTTRLQMIVDTFKWMYDVFRNNNVDVIVNCGDLFDSFNLKAQEISAMSEALSYGGDIPELHILGNHDIFDKKRSANAIALLNNYSHIDVVTDPLKLGCGVSLLPYCDADEAADVIPSLSNDILFSHIDIKGSYVTPQHVLDSGVSSSRLQDNFKRVINGHLHSPQSFDNQVFNIGASTSLSFSDGDDYIPRISVIDTNTLTLYHFNNPHAICFRKIDNGTLQKVQSLIDRTYNKLCIRVKCEPEHKVDITNLLSNSDKVVAYKVITNYSEKTLNDGEESEKFEADISQDIAETFKKFVHTRDDLKYPVSAYDEAISSLKGGDDGES